MHNTKDTPLFYPVTIHNFRLYLFLEGTACVFLTSCSALVVGLAIVRLNRLEKTIRTNRSRGRLIAKTVAKIVSRFRIVHSVSDMIETYAAFLQGKGSGSGWDGANEARALSSFVPDGPITVFDVGANNGRWSLEFAKIHRDTGSRFILIECAPYCFPGIEKRLPLIPHPTVIKCAMSDRGGVAILQLPTRGSGLASLHVRNDVSVVQETYTTLEVQTRTLDEIAESMKIDRIHVLKMDIEGHEAAALRGSEGMLEARRIDVIQFEFGSANVNSRTFFRDLWELLTSYDFMFYRIVSGGATIPIKEYRETLEYFRGATNYIAKRTT